MFNKRCAVVLACATNALTWAQGSATLEQQLRSKYALTSVRSDNSSFVVTGSSLTLRIRPLAAGATTNALTTTNTYRDGRLTSDAQGTVARASKSSIFGAVASRLPGGSTINDHVADAGAFRDFVEGEILYVTRIYADPSGSNVEFDLISDVQPDGRRYKAILNFPFFGSTDFARAQSIISQVFSVQNPATSTYTDVPPAADPPPATVSATLLLRNGTSVSGGWLPGNARQINLLINGQVATYSPSDVDQLVFASSAGPGQDNSGPPPQIAAGQTTDQVVGILGQPIRTALVGTRAIYFYKDVKVTFENGVVTDIQ
jgi:hypothetical protein